MKKKILLVLTVLAIVLSLGACKSKEDVYNEQVKIFKKVEIAELNKMIEEKKSFNIYLGRENCPYCQILVPQLDKLIKDEKVEIYYLDTLNTNKEMDNFFKEYKLEYVPSLMRFEEGKGEEIKLDHQQAKNVGKYEMEDIKNKFK